MPSSACSTGVRAAATTSASSRRIGFIAGVLLVRGTWSLVPRLCLGKQFLEALPPGRRPGRRREALGGDPAARQSLAVVRPQAEPGDEGDGSLLPGHLVGQFIGVVDLAQGLDDAGGVDGGGTGLL